MQQEIVNNIQLSFGQRFNKLFLVPVLLVIFTISLFSFFRQEFTRLDVIVLIIVIVFIFIRSIFWARFYIKKIIVKDNMVSIFYQEFNRDLILEMDKNGLKVSVDKGLVKGHIYKLVIKGNNKEIIQYQYEPWTKELINEMDRLLR